MEKRKKIGFVIIVIALLAIGFATSVSAATGWQKLGQDGINFYTYDLNKNLKKGFVHVSKDGGNIGIQILGKSDVYKTNGLTPVMEVRVYEDDGPDSLDDWIGTFIYYPLKSGDVTKTFNIDKFRDGADGKAEIEVRYTTNYQGTTWANILD